jgi:hypothetical protein
MTTLIRTSYELLKKMRTRREIPDRDGENIRYFVEKQKNNTLAPEEMQMSRDWLLAISKEDKIDVWCYILNLEQDELLRIPEIGLKKIGLL